MPTALLTDGERAAKLEFLLADKLAERGKLQLPQTRQYNQLNNDAGLLVVAKDMCRWLGTKPHGLHVRYSKTSDVTISENTISIDQRYADHPYAAGALLAIGVLMYYVERYDHAVPERSFIEYASLHTGLSLWVLNALQPRPSLAEKLYHAIDGRWFYTQGLQLEHYTAKQYAEQLVAYAHSNRIGPDTYLPGVNQQSAHLLPLFTLQASRRRLTDPEQILHHRSMAKQLWLKVSLIALIFAVMTTVLTYSITQRATGVSDVQRRDETSLKIMKQNFESCLQKVSDKQSTYDPNDLFMTRQIDASKAHCSSLRNEYNYALDQYQVNYPRN
jgi:hypothetical protein